MLSLAIGVLSIGCPVLCCLSDACFAAWESATDCACALAFGFIEAVINVSVTYTAKKTGLAPRTKTLVPGRGNTSYALTSINLNTQLANGQYHNAAPSRTPGERTSLQTYDVFNLVKIVDSGSLTANVTNAMMTQTA